MTWDYRIIRAEHESGEVVFRIHEVYNEGDVLPRSG